MKRSSVTDQHAFVLSGFQLPLASVVALATTDVIEPKDTTKLPRSCSSLNVVLKQKQTERLTVLMCVNMFQWQSLHCVLQQSSWKLKRRSTAHHSVSH